jgi:ribosomal protein S18 acetylase RimI-like enzyme
MALAQRMIKIKPMLPAQWQLHKAVRCAALADAPYAYSSTLERALKQSDDDWATLTRQRASDTNGITYFAFEGETPCGMAACRVESDEAEMFAVWVAPTHRRKGVGLALVEFAGNWARLHGARLLNVGVYDDNAEALAFYRSIGFGDTGKTKPELSTEHRPVLLLAMNLQR